MNSANVSSGKKPHFREGEKRKARMNLEKKKLFKIRTIHRRERGEEKKKGRGLTVFQPEVIL